MITLLLRPLASFAFGLLKYIAIGIGAGVLLEAAGYDVMDKIIDFIVNSVSWGLL